MWGEHQAWSKRHLLRCYQPAGGDYSCLRACSVSLDGLFIWWRLTLNIWKHPQLTASCYLMLFVWEREHFGVCSSVWQIFLFISGIISYTEYLFLLCILTSEYKLIWGNKPPWKWFTDLKPSVLVIHFVFFQSLMPVSGSLSTCLMQMEMKWWTKGSFWWYEPVFENHNKT